MFKLCIFAAILATALAAPAPAPAPKAKPSILGYDAPLVSAPLVTSAHVVPYTAPVSTYVAPYYSSHALPVSSYVAPVSSSFAYAPVSSYSHLNSYVAPLSYSRYVVPSYNAYHTGIY